MFSDLLLGFLVALFSHKIMSSKFQSTEMYTAFFLLLITFSVIILRIYFRA